MVSGHLQIKKGYYYVVLNYHDDIGKALSYQSYEKTEILFLSAKRYGKVSINGDMLTESNIFNSVLEVNLDTVIGFKKGGIARSFLDDY